MECGMTAHLMMILKKSNLHEEFHEVDHHENGASWLIKVDIGEPVGSTGHGAATGTRETTLKGGLKNSSNLVLDLLLDPTFVMSLRFPDLLLLGYVCLTTVVDIDVLEGKQVNLWFKRSSLSRPRPDAITKSLTPSLDGSRWHRFIVSILYDPFSGSTTTHSNDPSPSSSPVKTSDNIEKFTDELAPLDSLPPGNNDSTLKKDLHEENFQVYSNPLFEFDDNFKSSTINPLFDKMEEDVEIKNSNVSNEPVLLNTPLSDKVECFAPEDDIDEIDAFLAIEVSSNFEEGYFDSEGDVTFLDNLLSDDTTHNLASEVISDHEPEQNESSITFSPKSDPLHHEFAGEPLTLPSRNNREFREYLSLVIVLYEISTSQSQENVHQSSVIESLPVSPIPVEDSDPVQEEIDIFRVPDDLIPPGVETDDSEDEDNELPNLDHQDDPSIPRPPPEPPDIEKCLELEAGILIIKVFKDVSKPHNFMIVILPTLPTLVSDLTFILFLPLFLSFGSEDTIFDTDIVTFHNPVAFSMEVSCVALPKDN
ncbi:hypothetical protein Tco_0655938 [Tanacetum coccineum]|uniref:Uncharacterized protein n=1 Tax=Tanacetum coccineum TaxID=301880 RepID=A0ABQ4X7F3_9ASTR